MWNNLPTRLWHIPYNVYITRQYFIKLCIPAFPEEMLKYQIPKNLVGLEYTNVETYHNTNHIHNNVYVGLTRFCKILMDILHIQYEYFVEYCQSFANIVMDVNNILTYMKTCKLKTKWSIMILGWPHNDKNFMGQ